MNESKYWFPVFLFLFFACKDTHEITPSGQKDSTVWPVRPVDITLPEVIFTAPDKISNGTSSYIISDQLISLVDATPENATIYISIYAFQDCNALVDALQRARSRGVKLHIMFDMSSHNEDLLRKNSVTINKLIHKDIEIVRVNNDAGSIAINHNKFMLFSGLTTVNGTLENVILQTSHNFTPADAARVQDAVILSHQGLYQAYLTYWQDMKTMAGQGMSHFQYREFHDPGTGITAYFHPKRKEGKAYGKDTILEILDDITDPAVSTVKIGMSGWADSRVSIIEKLEELLRQGATIEVITKSNIGPRVYQGLKALHQEGAFIKIYNVQTTGKQRIDIHAKFMLIEGMWKQEQTNLVITGSQNFSMNALKNNNETTLLFRDPPFYKRYDDYYQLLKKLPGVCCP